MAEVAILSLWQFVCPHCPHSARHWKEKDSRAHAEDHLYVQHQLDVPAEPFRRTWAFRIYHRDDGTPHDDFVGGTAPIYHQA